MVSSLLTGHRLHCTLSVAPVAIGGRFSTLWYRGQWWLDASTEGVSQKLSDRAFGSLLIF
jgi:hypothetical protein